MRINLAAGNEILGDDWLNHDRIRHREEIDRDWDLNLKEWPVSDETYDEVRAYDVLEHLDDIVAVMDEIWRILKPGGKFECKVCGWKNENYWIDITHRHAFTEKSMDYFDPETELGKEYNYYTAQKWKILSVREFKNNYFFEMEPRK